MPTTQTTQTLTLERNYKHTPAQVWAAWTSPAALEQWFFPKDAPSVKVPKFSAKVGAQYEIQFAPGKDMAAHTAIGKVTEVVAGKRLAFSWNWKGQPEMPGSIVTVDIAAAGTGTKLTLRHAGLPNADVAAHHKLGWDAILDRLTATKLA